MAMKTLIDRFERTVRELRAANGANVTVTFALATIPIVGFVGAAVDYSHANSVKTAMQAAADSTALMLSKTAATLTTAQLQTQATSYFTALFTRPEATGLTVNATYTTTNGSQVVSRRPRNVKANFMGLMGISTMKVAANSQVKWGNTRLRVALVLDNTGSMADDGKMPALITATKTLLTQFKSAAVNNGDVYVSIIPFVKDVNVGSSNYNATWIDWTDWNVDNGAFSIVIITTARAIGIRSTAVIPGRPQFEPRLRLTLISSPTQHFDNVATISPSRSTRAALLRL